ncbi:M48 family metallopeptidase [Tissierella creatinini]|nr:M48 family metallopeptidase [Tissierella creatinini]TJX66482.1 M48 family metallopeptidase [Soehngenia saccharolytica]
MNKKLQVFIIVLFVFLIAFISFVLIAEKRNIDELRTDYPNLKEEVYSYRMDGLKVWAIRVILSFGLPLFFLTSGLSQAISLRAGGKNLFLSGLVYGLIFFGIVFLINLPLNYYSSFYLGHKYGLSNQSFFRWLELNIKGFLVSDLVTSLFLWIPYYLIYKSPKIWWLKISILAIPIIVFLVFISPLVIDPIFNTYTSIEENDLGERIGLLLDKAGIGNADIYMVDKSKDTKTMNAYMTGIFNSRRIVLWDTTINNMTEDELLSITAHEIGHYVKGHIWQNILISILGTTLIMYLVYRLSDWILISSRGAFGFRNLYNYASIPLILLCLNIFNFFASPVSNYISRAMEIQADRYQITLTGDRESAATAMDKLYETSLGVPRPSDIYKLWYYTHPPLEERVEFYRNEEFD